jgi:hypothetical protein
MDCADAISGGEMKYEVIEGSGFYVLPSEESDCIAGVYSAEGVNENDEGQIYTTVFLGPDSKRRAEQFVTLMNYEGEMKQHDDAVKEAITKFNKIPKII